MRFFFSKENSLGIDFRRDWIVYLFKSIIAISWTSQEFSPYQSENKQCEKISTEHVKTVSTS